MRRKSKLISKKRLLASVKLFESKIDEEIKSIELNNGLYGAFIITDYNKYYVNLDKNSVTKICPELN